MKWWKILLIIGLCLSVPIIFIIAIFFPLLPVYERTDSTESGICVNIEGVQYKMLPQTKWTVDPGGKMIGYAGSPKTKIIEVVGDPERHFIYLHDFGTDMYYLPLYRADIKEPTVETIDKMIWADSIWQDDTSYYEKAIVDKEIIKEFFEALKNNKKVEVIPPLYDAKTNNKEHLMSINCYSSELPYAKYYLRFGIYEDKLVCTDSKTYYQVSKEMLEKLAGKPLQIDGYQS